MYSSFSPDDDTFSFYYPIYYLRPSFLPCCESFLGSNSNCESSSPPFPATRMVSALHVHSEKTSALLPSSTRVELRLPKLGAVVVPGIYHT